MKVLQVARENGRMVIEIDGPAGARALKDIAREMRRHPELVHAVVERVKAGRPEPGELPKATRDLEAERRRDEESGPPKNRAILEKPHRVYSHSPDEKQ